MDDVERDDRLTDLTNKMMRTADHREQNRIPAAKAEDRTLPARDDVISVHGFLTLSREPFYRLGCGLQPGLFRKLFERVVIRIVLR